MNCKTCGKPIRKGTYCNRSCANTYKKTVPMEKILTPEQMPKMKDFLKKLSYYGSKAVEQGVKPDVWSFMEEYVAQENQNFRLTI